MAIPKAKHDEPKKKKTMWDKLKNSALFILLVVIVLSTGIIFGIIWLSHLLSTGDLWW
ncbi:MAG: hypothetical protein HYT80_09135 [Euryarchaeota archaeon]|nr:hypothetical protein [Euryarchaeota archaeon]